MISSNPTQPAPAMAALVVVAEDGCHPPILRAHLHDQGHHREGRRLGVGRHVRGRVQVFEEEYW